MGTDLENMKDKKFEKYMIKSMENIKVFKPNNSILCLSNKIKNYNYLSLPLYLKIQLTEENHKTSDNPPFSKILSKNANKNYNKQFFNSHIIINLFMKNKSSLKYQIHKHRSKDVLKKVKFSSLLNISKKEKKNIFEGIPPPILNNNYNNMPSYTELLRKALYSTNSKEKISSNYNEYSNKSSHSRASSVNHSSSYKNEFLLEKFAEEHLHEDNQTLIQVISEKKIIDNDNYKEYKNNYLTNNECYQCYNNKIHDYLLNNTESLNRISEENENFFLSHDDFLVTISTTKNEVGIIQSKVESAKKMKLLNQSSSCKECEQKMNINNEMNNNLIKEKVQQYKINSDKNIEIFGKKILNH